MLGPCVTRNMKRLVFGYSNLALDREQLKVEMKNMDKRRLKTMQMLFQGMAGK